MIQLLLFLAFLGLAAWFLFPAALMGAAMGVGAVAWLAGLVVKGWPYLLILAIWLAGFLVISRFASSQKALEGWFMAGPVMAFAYIVWLAVRP